MNPADKPSLTRTLLPALALGLAFGSAAARTPAKPRLSSGDPCTVVPLADIQKAFPGAQAGVRKRDAEETIGWTQCGYSHANGYLVFGVIEQYSDIATVLQDAKDMASLGNLNPFAPVDKTGARFEKIAGLGVDAIAYAETEDRKRGILTDGGFLVLRKGQHTVTLLAPTLPGADRPAALKLLEALGRIAVKRLD